MTTAFTVWATVGVLLTTILLSIALKYTGLWDSMHEMFAQFRHFFNTFISTAPKPLLILIFLFLILTSGGFIMGAWLNFMYVCDSQENLNTWEGGVFGGVAGSLQSAFSGYEYGEYDCIGTRQAGCSSFLSENDCSQFNNFTWGSDQVNLCEWNSGECLNDEIYNWARSCDFMPLNQTQCNLVICEYVSEDVQFDDWVENHTYKSQVYDANSPEGMFYPQCVGQSLVMTFHGVNIFGFRLWIMLILIMGFFSLGVKLKSTKTK